MAAAATQMQLTAQTELRQLQIEEAAGADPTVVDKTEAVAESSSLSPQESVVHQRQTSRLSQYA